MLCPSCGEENNRVIRTYQANDANIIVRVRQCLCCGSPFLTEEMEARPKKRPGVDVMTGRTD
jgi:transcriptional regulator NrdR family protein